MEMAWKGGNWLCLVRTKPQLRDNTNMTTFTLHTRQGKKPNKLGQTTEDMEEVWPLNMQRTGPPACAHALAFKNQPPANGQIAGQWEPFSLGDAQIEEVGEGYTLHCTGKSEYNPRTSGVGFAIRTKLAQKLDSVPHVFMIMQLMLTKDRFGTIISAYAPTMTNPDDIKEVFYKELNRVITAVNHKDKLIILGDFNAHVGRDHSTWHNVLGLNGTGNCISNGQLLLSLCAQDEISIANTIFQHEDKFKNTWMHPHSKQWHILDNVIVRQRDRRDVLITRCMRGADCWSDHRLTRSKINIHLAPKNKSARDKPPRKLNIAHLCASTDTLGFVERKHREWFDENDPEINKLIDVLHKTHTDHHSDKTCEEKEQKYQQAEQLIQQKLRQMKNAWLEKKAESLQAAADINDMKTFHKGLCTIYGHRQLGQQPFVLLIRPHC
ncbi:uncharacterized protein LOC143281455 [Babylonia areolata]|uniref:uncharacterized protein LOC143281455 n=1 Tax=Babylonia areolata TaxID=304850 RepID=UPI003FD0B7CE